MDWTTIALTVRLAIWVCGILVVLGTPIAYWMAFSRWRFAFVVESVVALPLVLPPTVLGFYVLLALGAESPIGRAWNQLTGRGLAFTFEGLVIASVLYSLPFMVQPAAAAFRRVDPSLIEASATLGASRTRTFRAVILPLAADGLLTGVVLSFAHTVGEFGVVLMIGGNVPGVTRTVSLAIYDHVQALEYDAAHRTALLLLAFSFVVVALTQAIQRRAWTTVNPR
ncbi:MAG: molybdate ABC transporter permease subunit [Acidimicrobiia bacterium]|nr:molybdate ABC transporter permease subunit [Acidimicrobiia bacterium]